MVVTIEIKPNFGPIWATHEQSNKTNRKPNQQLPPKLVTHFGSFSEIRNPETDTNLASRLDSSRIGSNGRAGSGRGCRHGVPLRAPPRPSGGGAVGTAVRAREGGGGQQDEAHLPHPPALRCGASLLRRKLRPRVHRKSPPGVCFNASTWNWSFIHFTRSVFYFIFFICWFGHLQLPGDIEWHFIGHLQSNKAKALLGMIRNYKIAIVSFVELGKWNWFLNERKLVTLLFQNEWIPLVNSGRNSQSLVKILLVSSEGFMAWFHKNMLKGRLKKMMTNVGTFRALLFV